MERWEAERIAKFPRWTGYLAVAVYGPLTFSVMALEALEGGEAYGETGFLVTMGWGLFGVLAGILSTASRLTVWHSLIQAAGLRRAYHKFRKGYEHEVEEEME